MSILDYVSDELKEKYEKQTKISIFLKKNFGKNKITIDF